MNKMYIEVRDLTDVYAIRRWLSDNISPGQVDESWTTRLSGLLVYVSSDGVSWRVVHRPLYDKHAEVYGLTPEQETLLRLSLDNR